MAIKIWSPEHYDKMLDRALQERDLFGFFLYAERSGHSVVEKFARREHAWLNSLANSVGMFLFYYESKKISGVKKSSSDDPRNPSLEVAGSFGITPELLPGMVFFIAPESGDEDVQRGVFVPLELALFREDPNAAEEAISELFGIIMRARQKSDSPEDLLKQLQKGVNGMRRSKKFRPLKKHLRQAAVYLTLFPGNVLTEMGKEFAKQMAKGPSPG